MVHFPLIPDANGIPNVDVEIHFCMMWTRDKAATVYVGRLDRRCRGGLIKDITSGVTTEGVKGTGVSNMIALIPPQKVVLETR